MKNKNMFLRVWWVGARRQIDQVTSGSEPGVPLDAPTRHNLRWFWLDGLFASASD